MAYNKNEKTLAADVKIFLSGAIANLMQWAKKMAIFDVVIQVVGDWAFIRCNFTVTMIPKAGGEPLYMDSKDLSIMERQADGSWKIYWDIFNSNVPPPPPVE